MESTRPGASSKAVKKKKKSSVAAYADDERFEASVRRVHSCMQQVRRVDGLSRRGRRPAGSLAVLVPRYRSRLETEISGRLLSESLPGKLRTIAEVSVKHPERVWKFVRAGGARGGTDKQPFF